MADVAGMDDELRRNGQRIYLCDGLLQRCGYIFVCRFVEAHVAVANLDKIESSPRRAGGSMSDLAVGDPAADCPEEAGPHPGHAFQKAAAIDAVRLEIPE